jgi:hypothetical protein
MDAHVRSLLRQASQEAVAAIRAFSRASRRSSTTSDPALCRGQAPARGERTESLDRCLGRTVQKGGRCARRHARDSGRQSIRPGSLPGEGAEAAAQLPNLSLKARLSLDA